MRLLTMAGAAVVALVLAAAGRAGDQAYLSWSVEADEGHGKVTWTITGSTRWYVGVVKLASRPDLDASGDFPAENLVAYDVLTQVRSAGTWRTPFELDPGTYYAQLTLRYDGACDTKCESRSSVRSFAIEPPPLASLSWKARGQAGKVLVAWAPPGQGWHVSMVLVDDDRDFSSPEDAVSWPAEPSSASWTSRRLDPDTYYVRVYARYADCDTCLWSSKSRKVEVKASNPLPRLKGGSIAIVRRDASTLRHTWRASLTVCDRSPGALTVQIRQETWRAGSSTVQARTSTVRLAAPRGCRSYRIVERSAWPFRSGTYVRGVLRVRDGEGAWSAGQRSAQWYTP